MSDRRVRKKAEVFWHKRGKNAAAWAVSVLLAVSCLLFYGLGMAKRQELLPYNHLVTLIGADGGNCSYQEAEQMRRRNQEVENPFSYVLWGNAGISSLQNGNLGRDAKAEIYVVEGSSDLLLSSDVILDGTVKKSCLIGEDIAQALFGSSDAVGLSVTLDGQDYIVLGMLADAKQAAVFSAKDVDGCSLDRMNVRVSEDVTLFSLEQNLEGELGFVGEALDYRLMNGLAGVMGFGLCFLVWLWLMHRMLTELKKYRNAARDTACGKFGCRTDAAYIRGMAVRLGCAAGMILMLGICLRLWGNMPEDLIPTKWSDFEFWSRLFDDKSERILNWIKCEKRASELLYLKKSAGAMIYLAISYLSYLLMRAIVTVQTGLHTLL